MKSFESGNSKSQKKKKGKKKKGKGRKKSTQKPTIFDTVPTGRAKDMFMLQDDSTP